MEIEKTFYELVKDSLDETGVTPMPAIILHETGTRFLSIDDSTQVLTTVFKYCRDVCGQEFIVGSDAAAMPGLGLNAESLVVVFHVKYGIFRVGYIPYTGLEMGELTFGDAVAQKLTLAYANSKLKAKALAAVGGAL